MFRLLEKILIITGLLYMSQSFDNILPSSFLSLTQYGTYAATFLLLLARWKRTLCTARREFFIWILLTLALFSFLWSDLPAYTLRNAIVAWQTASFSLYMASCYGFKEQLRLIAIAMGIAGILCVFYAILLPGQGVHFDAHAGAWKGIYTHKNYLSQVATYSSVVFLLLAMNVQRRRWLVYGGLMLSVGLLILSTSKTGLLVFLTLLILLQLYRSLRWRKTKAVLILIIIVLISASILVMIIANAEPILNSLGRDLTLTGRTEIWAGAINFIRLRPWLGYGRGAFWHPNAGRSLTIGEVVSPNYQPPHSHNGYVDLTADLGLVGLSLFFLSFLVTWIRGYNLVRLTRSSEYIWPILYSSFIILYNFTESSIMKHNSAFWMTYMMVALSIKPIRKSSKYFISKES